MAYDYRLGYDPDKDYSLALADSSLSAAERAQLTSERQAKIDAVYGGNEPTYGNTGQTFSSLYGADGSRSSGSGSSGSGSGGGSDVHWDPNAYASAGGSGSNAGSGSNGTDWSILINQGIDSGIDWRTIQAYNENRQDKIYGNYDTLGQYDNDATYQRALEYILQGQAEEDAAYRESLRQAQQNKAGGSSLSDVLGALTGSNGSRPVYNGGSAAAAAASAAPAAQVDPMEQAQQIFDSVMETIDTRYAEPTYTAPEREATVPYQNATPEEIYQAMMNTVDQQYEQPAYVPSEWDATRDALAKAALEMSYNDWTQSDQYSRLANRYGASGQRAMNDVLGQIASRTGGLASSYAATAAQQQYNDYMARLEDAAQAQYASERNNAIQNAQLAQGFAEEDYQKYLDQLAQYNTDRGYAFDVLARALAQSNYASEWQNTLDQQDYQRYLNELSQYNANRSFAADALSRALAQSNYANEWQNTLTQQEYQRYLDELAQYNTDRQYNLDVARAALAQDNYTSEQAYGREQDALARQDSLAKLGAQFGDYSGVQSLGIDTSNYGDKLYAYSADGDTYTIGSAKGQQFISDAVPGQTMTGGDGSQWTKNADGSVTISKGGQVYTLGGSGATQQYYYNPNPQPDNTPITNPSQLGDDARKLYNDVMNQAIYGGNPSALQNSVANEISFRLNKTITEPEAEYLMSLFGYGA